MSLSTIRDGLKTRLATISSLAKRSHDTWPDTINTPCAIVLPLRQQFHQTFGDPAFTIQTLEIVLLAAPLDAGGRQAQDALDAYLDDTGASSIRAAIEGDETLGGAATACFVSGWRDYGPLEVNGITYLGVKFDVEVWP